MSRDEFGKDILSNIEISSDIKKELYENCKKGRRTADFRTRHTGALTVMAVAAIIGCTGIGASACYETVARRLESMKESEREEYVQELCNDTGITIDDAWSRKLTDQEVLRLAQLEEEYYNQNLFPQEDLLRVNTLDEWDGTTICYVEEDHLLHLPESDMTDEELLQFIDHTAKRDYVLEQEAKERFSEDEESPYVDVDQVTQDDLVKIAYKELVKFLGEELSGEWQTQVEAFEPSKVDPELGTSHDMYTIYWTKAQDSSFGTEYVVVLGMHDLKLGAVAVDGREYWATLGSYTDEDALAKAEKDMAKVIKKISEMYGYSNPNDERVEVWHEYDDYGDARQSRYIFQYGETAVDVIWDLADERLASVEIYPTEYIFVEED